MPLVVGSFNRTVGNFSRKAKLLLSAHINSLRIILTGRMPARIEFTEEQLEKMIEMYQRGCPGSEIAEELGVSRNTVLSRLRKAGIRIRTNEINLTEEELEEMKKKYREGVTSAELAEHFGVSQDTILRRLRKKGCGIRPPADVQNKINFTGGQIEEICDEYRQGAPATEIAERLGIGKFSIYRVLRENDCRIRSPGPEKGITPWNYVERDIPDPWEDIDAAYVFGVLIGDGSVINSSDPRGISVGTPDKEFVNLFSRTVKSAFGIETCDHSNRKKSPEVNANSVDLGRSYDNFKWRKETWRVPEQFFDASRDIRTSLCQGKLDSDGYVDKNAIAVTSIYEPGLEDLLKVVENLNFETTFNGPYPQKNPNAKDQWVLRILNASPELFKLPRKKKLL